MPDARIIPTSSPASLRLAHDAMGTRFELLLAGDDSPRLRAAGEAALHEIEQLDQRLSYFRPDSIISRINRHAALAPFPLDHDIFELLTLCRDTFLASRGAFDITIAPLMHAFGFRATSVFTPTLTPDLARECIGSQHLHLDPIQRTIAFSRPGMAIDLGAIAKGWAIDIAAASLRDAGITSAFLHGGSSSCYALGPRPDGQPWLVRIAGPAPLRTIPLQNASLSVSAPHGRQVTTPSGLIGHILDPGTGLPARAANLAACTHPSAAIADAWSTSLLIADPITSSMSLPPALSWTRYATSYRGPLGDLCFARPSNPA